MKPPPFAYHTPSTVAEAVRMLSTLENARVLAGGQSLMPMLNMRFTFPDHLIDLNRVAGLSGISAGAGVVRIGAMTRQRDVQDHPAVRGGLPLLAEALSFVGHRQTRNRGTIGGSLCHLDPAAELVAAAVALDASLEITGPRGSRTVAATAFPEGYMTPALASDELLTAVVFPLPPPGQGACFTEFSRRHGDYAIVSAAALLTPAAGGRIGSASLTLGGVGPVPVRVREAETRLAGAPPSTASFAEAADACGTIEAMEDAQVPGWYRRRLAATLMRRALHTAQARWTVE